LLLSNLKYDKASVIADSYIGAFPLGFQGPVFKSLRVCRAGVLDFSRNLLTKCHDGDITIPDVFEAVMSAFPMVDFGSVNSKFDEEQLNFYKLASISMGKVKTGKITPEEMYGIMSGILGRYKRFKNHGHLLLTSTWHVYTFMAYNDYGKYTDLIFTDGSNGTLRVLDSWLDHFAKHDHAAERLCELMPGYAFREKVMLDTAMSDYCDGKLGHRIISLWKSQGSHSKF